MIKLSYIIATKNKLNLLKISVERLLAFKETDEELIVIDGGSSDGTYEYLNNLHIDSKVDVFISESDFGEAHAFNKGIMKAKGELIKFISDDDIFFYPVIKAMKKYMIENNEIDVIGCEGGNAYIYSDKLPITKSDYSKQYLDFLDKMVPFDFSGLGLMIRKEAIPILGLLSTTMDYVDLEYTLRITKSKARFSWCTGAAWFRLINSNSNSYTKGIKITEDKIKSEIFYKGLSLKTISNYIFISIKLFLLKFKNLNKKAVKKFGNNIEIDEQIILIDKWFRKQEASESIQFLCRKNV